MERLKYLLLASLATSSVATAQSYPKPPDVPAYVQINGTYVTGAGNNQPGINPPPAFSTHPADPNPSAPENGWLVTGGGPQFTTGDENKFRTHANVSQVLFDDSIRNYGQPGTSHCHMFYGNRGANGYSTYASLRNKPASNAAGGPLNGSAYWFPCVVKTNPFGDGRNYAVKADFINYYYTGEHASQSARMVGYPRGLRFVMGVDMDNPDGAPGVGLYSQQSEINAANAAHGSTRYVSWGNGFKGWICRQQVSGEPIVPTTWGTSYSPYLKSTTGADPWGGNCKSSFDATGSTNISAELFGPGCWDGTNLWSPGGYRHMRMKAHDNSVGSAVCPNGWYYVATLNLKIKFSHNGFADYGEWRLSSDNAAGTIAGRTFANGESFHADFQDGWKYTIRKMWEDNCIGTNNNPPHDCNTSTVSATQVLTNRWAAPDGRNPQIDLNTMWGTATADRMVLIGTTHAGPVVVHHSAP